MLIWIQWLALCKLSTGEYICDPSTGMWRQGDQKFEVVFSYMCLKTHIHR